MVCTENRFFQNGTHFILIGSKDGYSIVNRTQDIKNLVLSKRRLAYSNQINDETFDIYFNPDCIVADPSFGFVSKLDEALDGINEEGFEVKYSLSGICNRSYESPIFHHKLMVQIGYETPIGFLDEGKNQLVHIRNNGSAKPVTFVVQTKGQSSKIYEWDNKEFQKMLIAHPIWKNLRHGLARNFNLKNPDEMDVIES
jgi:hypothetical protein